MKCYKCYNATSKEALLNVVGHYYHNFVSGKYVWLERLHYVDSEVYISLAIALPSGK